MVMCKTWRAILFGVLALVGAAAMAVIAISIHHTGGGCVPTRESRYLAPDGATATTVEIATCRRDTEVSVELTESGKTYMLFLASSPQASPSIELQWSSPMVLELHYPAGMRVRIPPEMSKVGNFFGKTEVIYKAE
jgi:hypothetical protein